MVRQKKTKLRMISDAELDRLVLPLEDFRAQETAMQTAETRRAAQIERLKAQLEDQHLEQELGQAIDLMNERCPGALPASASEALRGAAAFLNTVGVLRHMGIEFSETNNQSLYEALGVSEDTVRAGFKLGQELTMEEDFSNARQVLLLMTMLAPRLVDLWNAYGLAFMGEERIEDAAGVFQVASSMFPEDVQVRYNLVACQVLMEDDEAAGRSLEELEGIFEKSPVLLEESLEDWQHLQDLIKQKRGES